MSNSIMYSSHATTHFNLVRLFLRRMMSTQHWSRVVSRKQTRQRMESAIETSDLKLSGIWYKRPRIMMRSMSERSTLLQQISTSVGTSLEGDVGTYSGGNLSTVTY